MSLIERASRFFERASRLFVVVLHAILSGSGQLKHRWVLELTREDRKAILRYGIALVWAIVFSTFTPTLFASVANTLAVLFLTVIVGLGAIFAAYGRFTFRHLTWELRGLFLVVSGLAFYTIMQAILAIFLGIPSGNTDRIALVVFAYWLTAEVGDRLEYLGRKYLHLTRATAAERETNRVEGVEE